MELMVSWMLEAARDKEESGTDESQECIIRRKQIEAFKDPKLRKKYGHLFDLDRLGEEADEEDSIGMSGGCL